ncbi:glycosyltransferase family 9 protein [candidate division KSB1 bacterium]
MDADIKRILLIQFRPVGDVLLCTPLITILRRRFPQAHIAFMVEPLPGQMLEHNPGLDEILYYRHRKDDIMGSFRFFREAGKQKWDLTIDMFGTPGTAWATLFSRAKIKIGYSLRGRKYAYNYRVNNAIEERYSALKKLALLKVIGIEEETHRLTLNLTDEERDFAAAFFRDNNIGEDGFTVCFAPGAKRQAKGWIAERWAQLGDLLDEKFNAQVILLWGPGEAGVVSDIVEGMTAEPYVIPGTTLREMAAIIERAKLCVSNCSGTKHIATAVGIPTITVYGPTSPVTWTYPDPERHRFVRSSVSCIECNVKYCSHRSCMYEVYAEDIVREMHEIPEVRILLNGNSHAPRH